MSHRGLFDCSLGFRKRETESSGECSRGSAFGLSRSSRIGLLAHLLWLHQLQQREDVVTPGSHVPLTLCMTVCIRYAQAHLGAEVYLGVGMHTKEER